MLPQKGWPLKGVSGSVYVYAAMTSKAGLIYMRGWSFTKPGGGLSNGGLLYTLQLLCGQMRVALAMHMHQMYCILCFVQDGSPEDGVQALLASVLDHESPIDQEIFKNCTGFEC